MREEKGTRGERERREEEIYVEEKEKNCGKKEEREKKREVNSETK